jgi:predicted GH43/DUF377 family glycosyl hydrolase
VFNPGATTGPGGETILLVRVEDRSGRSHLTLARSADGFTDWDIAAKPTLERGLDRYHEFWGIEDPRITVLDGDYFIAYTGVSPGGPLVCLTSTPDFEHFQTRPPVSPPEDKDAALFPVCFEGRYAMIHRPVSSWAPSGAHMWISFSPDLIHWGDHRVLLESRTAGDWDYEKVGLGPPPLRTDEGWLLLYHGVRSTAAGSLYRAGLALLDLEDPRVVIARCNEWVFGPEAPYERAGDVPGVVFPTGWIEDGDGNVRMYYGAADSCVGVATARIADLVQFVFSHAA